MQVNAVATRFVDSEEIREILLRKMEESKSFVGEQGGTGERGDQGIQGIQGPAWEPTLTFFELVAVKDNPDIKKMALEAHKFCALAGAGEAHQGQSCFCGVEQTDKVWQFSLIVDRRAIGRCNCNAVCVD